MKTITLYTANGHIVPAEVEVPQFKVMPDIIVWGNRFFLSGNSDRYVEVCAYVVPVSIKSC